MEWEGGGVNGGRLLVIVDHYSHMDTETLLSDPATDECTHTKSASMVNEGESRFGCQDQVSAL